MYWILTTEEEVNQVKTLLNILNDYTQKIQNVSEKSLKQKIKQDFKKELKDRGPILIFDLISRIGNQLYIPIHIYRKIISKNKDSIELNRKLAYEFSKKLIRDSAMEKEPLQELEMKDMNREELIIITTFIYMFYEIDNVKEVIKDTNEVAMIHIKKRFEITWKTKMYWKFKLVDILEGLKSK
ncbi:MULTISPECIES: hypothetical protein [Bacillus]|uniref:Uncharacterized protein n=2 Tax=Bacillus thuringiensis TaxID=1428 RepID=A0AAP4Q713_BACTU|nr:MULTISPECIES: hypothetical protein [Bacillus]MEC0046264.1 hypothetical protein [Bacillus cereus]AFV21627.1 hypothetical protein BTB_502p03220 [Bacillus thuringiensis Bt407]EEM25343.1 hypothetical protein bthur0002_59850 [Bacillus thuringiensis Bt407]ERI01197.1 hypothetical protein BTCBT_002752 [Bacillus thuringiensis T01-328]MBN6707949.1 hypothetical protein [Bacillus thuringiensis]